jgi:hypothetical protein
MSAGSCTELLEASQLGLSLSKVSSERISVLNTTNATS